MRKRYAPEASACSNWQARAYCEHDYDFARLLTRVAMEVFARAKDTEESYAAIRLDDPRRPLRHRR